MSILVDAMVFFELSTDDDVDPDVAVGCLEDLSSAVRHLTPSELAAFAAFVSGRAAREPATDVRKALSDIAEDLSH